jgi:hypothetical protein
MSNDELTTAAARELRHLDPRFRFWIALGISKPQGSHTSANDVDWTNFDWASLRDDLEAWLEDLSDDTAPETSKTFLVTDELALVFLVEPRRKAAVGYRRMPSFKHSDPDPFPPLNFADGSTGALEALSIAAVSELAAGQRALVIALPSHREAWDVLREAMQAAGISSTSEMDRLQLETTASMLALTEPPSGPLGDFDEGWRAINRVDMPIVDDPRDDG